MKGRLYIDENKETFYDFGKHAFYLRGEKKQRLRELLESTLACLAVHPGTVTYDIIMSYTRGNTDYRNSNVHTDIHEIRDFFEQYGIELDKIITHRGEGYECNYRYENLEQGQEEQELVSETTDSPPSPASKSTENNTVLARIRDIITKHPSVSSYAYIHDLHSILVMIEQNKSDRDLLEAQLKNYTSSNADSQAFYFTIYYVLSLYCKRKDRIRHFSLSLDNLIKTYGSVFKDFPLSFEIYSWYARRIDQLDEAFQCDKILISKLRIEENAGVYNSFASSVAQRLETEYNEKRNGHSTYFWTNNFERIVDWTRALEYMPKVNEFWKKTWGENDGYGKHFFIYGKLMLFSPRMGELSPQERRSKIQEASEQFERAYECEQDSPDSTDRRNIYKEYIKKCEECLEFWNTKTMAATYSLTTEVLFLKNTRSSIVKPNEDYYIQDDENRIYLIADGVTRPHDEYLCSQESLAAQCSEILCNSIRTEFLNGLTNDIAYSFISAMKKANENLGALRFKQQTDFYPCSTFIGAIIRDNTLFFSNCGDTIGIIIRNQTKITFSEKHNAMAEKLKLTKQEVYQYVHNKKERTEGFAIFNGDPSISDFLHVGYLSLLPHDRVILASDGLADYLYYTKAVVLATASKDEIIEQSQIYDNPPFHEYADDKTCIIIDVHE